MTQVTIYGSTNSNYTRSVRMALDEKGVAYDWIELFRPDIKSPANLQRHPFGKMPSLEHGAFVLYETQAILRYIDESFAGEPLQPVDALPRARMNQLLSIADNYAWPNMVQAIFFQRIMAPRFGLAVDESAVAAALPQAHLCLTEFERLMADGPFLVGDQVTLADLMVAPIIACFSRTREGVAAIKSHPGLAPWWERMSARSSMLRTTPRVDWATQTEPQSKLANRA
jgi:glutathione S-transferase